MSNWIAFLLEQRVSKKMTLVGFAIFSFQCVSAQLTTSNFEDYSQTQWNPYIQNPAILDTSYSFCLKANQIINTGLFSNISKFYVDADKKIKSSNSDEKHYLGFQAVNSKYGDFINKSNLVLRYSWYRKLNDKVSFSSGFSLGFLNLSFLTSNGGGGGSALGPDASLGMRIMSKRISFGFSSNQIFNTILVPLTQTYVFNRTYQIEIQKNFKLSPNIQMLNLISLETKDDLNFFYGINSNLVFWKNTFLSYNYNVLNKSTFGAGLSNLKWNNTGLNLGASYSMYHKSSLANDPNMEIFVAFFVY